MRVPLRFAEGGGGSGWEGGRKGWDGGLKEGEEGEEGERIFYILCE